MCVPMERQKMSNKKQKFIPAQELSCDIDFKRTVLGQAVFVKRGDRFSNNCVRPKYFTPTQLRVIADFIEKNPSCNIFDDVLLLLDSCFLCVVLC